MRKPTRHRVGAALREVEIVVVAARGVGVARDAEARVRKVVDEDRRRRTVHARRRTLRIRQVVGRPGRPRPCASPRSGTWIRPVVHHHDDAWHRPVRRVGGGARPRRQLLNRVELLLLLLGAAGVVQSQSLALVAVRLLLPWILLMLLLEVLRMGLLLRYFHVERALLLKLGLKENNEIEQSISLILDP